MQRIHLSPAAAVVGDVVLAAPDELAALGLQLPPALCAQLRPDGTIWCSDGANQVECPAALAEQLRALAAVEPAATLALVDNVRAAKEAARRPAELAAVAAELAAEADREAAREAARLAADLAADAARVANYEAELAATEAQRADKYNAELSAAAAQLEEPVEE